MYRLARYFSRTAEALAPPAPRLLPTPDTHCLVVVSASRLFCSRSLWLRGNGIHRFRLQSSSQLHAWRRNLKNLHGRQFSSFKGKDEVSIEEDAERKIGWLLKLFFAGTATFFGYQFFPYMGDNLMQQSVSLVRVKDPLFKRMGASRLSRFAIDDERRVKIVEMGGLQVLLNMLEVAKDDRTRKEALKALVALSHSDIALEALHQAGAVSVVHSATNSSEDSDIVMYKSILLKRFQDLRYNTTTSTD